MPTIWHLQSNFVGVVHPYRADGTAKTVSYLLSIYEWNRGSMQRIAHIKLWEIDYHDKLYMVNMLNYQIETDRCTIAFANVYVVPGEIPGVKLIDFNVTSAINECKGKVLQEAKAPAFLKSWTFDKEITTMVALHFEKSDGALFLLC